MSSITPSSTPHCTFVNDYDDVTVLNELGEQEARGGVLETESIERLDWTYPLDGCVECVERRLKSDLIGQSKMSNVSFDESQEISRDFAEFLKPYRFRHDTMIRVQNKAIMD